MILDFFVLDCVPCILNIHIMIIIIFRAGTFGAIFEYGAEKKVSQNSSLAASLSLGVPTGVQLKVK